MVTLMQRRREMMRLASAPTPIVCPYITEGLIFWLDGIERGGVTGQWKDLIGGKIFTLFGVTEDADGIVFAGETTSYATYDGVISSNWQTETLEIAKPRTAGNGSGMCIFCPAGNVTPIGVGLIYGGSNSTKFSINIDGVSVYNWGVISPIAWSRMSVNANGGIANGNTSVSRQGTKDSWGKNQSGTTYLGCRYTTTKSRPYTGKLYSVRIYNRLLTTDEMKANQAVDALRFNLT